MTERATPSAARRLERRNLAVLAAGPALGYAGAPLVIFTGGLIGGTLAPDPALATLPIAAVVVGGAANTIPAAMLMRRVGRRSGFVAGALLGTFAALAAAAAVQTGRFFVFTIATLLIGASQAFVHQYRFAAVESVTQERSARAVSVVLLGGVAAGFIGPEIARLARGLLPAEFAGSFLALSTVYAALAIIVSRLRVPPIAAQETNRGGRSTAALLAHPPLALAVLMAASAFAAMSFIMTATPISMHTHAGHSVDVTARVIQGHAIAMYLPALFTGSVIARLGVARTLAVGLAFLAASAGLGASGDGVAGYAAALILLGLGWNLLFIASTVLLARSYAPQERFRAQALNDFIVFGIQSTAALGAGAALQRFGWVAMNAAVLVLVLALGVVLAAAAARSRGLRPATAGA